VARHEDPGPLWNATLEGTWKEDAGGFLLATADYVATRDVPGLPDIARYEVDDGGIWLIPEADSSASRRLVETVQLTGTELSLQLPDGVRTFRRTE
jgi:hypothetical protein